MTRAPRRLFVSRGSHVIAVDTDSGKVVGDITGTEGVHGIALAPGLGRGFTSNGRSMSVSVFNLSTLVPTSTVKVTGKNPDAILFDPSSKRVFSFNGRGVLSSLTRRSLLSSDQHANRFDCVALRGESPRTIVTGYLFTADRI